MPTSFKQVANNAQSTATSGSFNNTTSPLTFSVQSGHGARFPSPGNGFYLTVWNSASYPDPFADPNMEIVLCTARTTDSLTVTRAQRGTTATAKSGTPDVRLLVDSSHISDLNTAVATLEAAIPAFYSASYTDTVSNGSPVAKTINLGVNRSGCIIFVNDSTENYGGCIFVGTSAAQYIGTQGASTDDFYSTRNSVRVRYTAGSPARDTTMTASLSGSTLTLTFTQNQSGYSQTLATQVYVMAF